MKGLIFVLLFVSYLTSTYARSVTIGGGKPPSGLCACTALFAPVCGKDGKTYSNEGCAKCAGVDVECKGSCPCGGGLATCTCINVSDPVCGVDGKTYGNECLASCQKVKVDCKGKCPCRKQCICTREYRPVCSTANKTFGNKCEAGCAGAKIACNGECPCPRKCNGPQVRCAKNPCDGATCSAVPKAKCRANYCGGCNTDFILDGKYVDCDPSKPCVCTKQYAPVCGVDGKTYGNSCGAGCKGVKVECKGECPCKKPCVCTQQYDPVCGVDGKTYGNSCGAGCKGVKVECKGECPCKPKCDGQLYKCFRNPCDGATCRAYPKAICKANYCNGCNAEFFKDGVKVDCNRRVCGQEGAECDYGMSYLSQYSKGQKCCSGLSCCRCQPVERSFSFYTPSLKGKCQKECTQCKG